MREDSSKLKKKFIEDIHKKQKFTIKIESIKASECELAKLQTSG